MKHIYPIITVLAVLGYLVSVVFYALTFDDIDPRSFSGYSYLTFLLFGTWIVAVLKLSTSQELKAKKQGNPITTFKVIFKGTPPLVSIIAGLSLIFAMISFGLIMYTQKGVVSIIDGERVIHNHGDVIKVLTEQEYRHAIALEARGFIGHYLAFFGVGAAILFPKKTANNEPSKGVGNI